MWFCFADIRHIMFNIGSAHDGEGMGGASILVDGEEHFPKYLSISSSDKRKVKIRRNESLPNQHKAAKSWFCKNAPGLVAPTHHTTQLSSASSLFVDIPFRMCHPPKIALQGRTLAETLQAS
jgi:hypothetical protein